MASTGGRHTCRPTEDKQFHSSTIQGRAPTGEADSSAVRMSPVRESMKNLRALSLLICLFLSAGGAAIAQAPAENEPAAPVREFDPGPRGESLAPRPAPEGVPADGQSGNEKGEQTAPPADIQHLPPELRRLLQSRQPLIKEVEPTPALREQLYKQLWSQLANEYVDESKLTDWDERLRKYDGKLNTAEEMDAAIQELIESVGDRWTKYQSPTERMEFSKMVKDGYVLAGLVLRRHADQDWHIDSIMFDSAAYLSELKEGDIIVSINGKKLDKLTEHEVIKLTAGRVGEVIKVVARWDGKEHTVGLTLNKPMEDTVLVRKLPDDVLYIRLPTYEKPEIIDEFYNKLKHEYYEAKGGLTGIVLDLRNNGGGLFDMALKTSSLFMESGTITKSTVHKGQLETVTEYRVRPMPQFAKRMMSDPHMLDFFTWLQNAPMVVLINGSTASASEVTAGALQDNGRAHVIGTHSFGKSVGFTIQELPNGGRFFMTSLKYLTPNGRDLVNTGIQPDQVVEMPRLAPKDLQLVAAHDYVVKLAAKRFQQVQDGKDLAGKPASELERLDANPYRTPLILIGFVIGLLILAYTQLASNKKK